MQVKSDVSRRGSADDGSEKLKVFLRIRPLTEAEKERGEEQVKEFDRLVKHFLKEGKTWLTKSDVFIALFVLFRVV